MAEYVTERFTGDLEILAPLLIPAGDVKTTTRELRWKCRETPHDPGDVWVVGTAGTILRVGDAWRFRFEGCQT